MSETHETTDACLDCVKSAGRMCGRHAREILPQLAEPWWYRHVKTGDANRSTEHPDHVRRRQRYERQEKARRIARKHPTPAQRLLLGTTGAFTGRNRRLVA